MFSKVHTCVCVCVSGTKNSQLLSAIGPVHKARGYEGEGSSTAGQPAGSLHRSALLGAGGKLHTLPACSAVAAAVARTTIYGSGIPVEKEDRD